MIFHAAQQHNNLKVNFIKTQTTLQHNVIQEFSIVKHFYCGNDTILASTM